MRSDLVLKRRAGTQAEQVGGGGTDVRRGADEGVLPQLNPNCPAVGEAEYSPSGALGADIAASTLWVPVVVAVHVLWGEAERGRPSGSRSVADRDR